MTQRIDGPDAVVMGAGHNGLVAANLLAYGLRWTHAPDVLAHVFPDDRASVLSRDADRTATSVGRFHPADATAWLALVDEWKGIEDLILTTCGHTPASRALRLRTRTAWPNR